MCRRFQPGEGICDCKTSHDLMEPSFEALTRRRSWRGGSTLRTGRCGWISCTASRAGRSGRRTCRSCGGCSSRCSCSPSSASVGMFRLSAAVFSNVHSSHNPRQWQSSAMTLARPRWKLWPKQEKKCLMFTWLCAQLSSGEPQVSIMETIEISRLHQVLCKHCKLNISVYIYVSI